jgi:hypothetical protein
MAYVALLSRIPLDAQWLARDRFDRGDVGRGDPDHADVEHLSAFGSLGSRDVRHDHIGDVREVARLLPSS